MKKSDEKESRDAVIFILAIIFLVVVLVSLGASFITYNVMRKEVKEIVANDQLSEEELQNISQTAALYTRRILKDEDNKPGVKTNDLVVVSEGVFPDTNEAIAGVISVGEDVPTDDANSAENKPKEPDNKPLDNSKKVSDKEKGGGPGTPAVQQLPSNVDEEGIIDRAIDKIKSTIDDKIGNDKYKDLVKRQDDRSDAQDKINDAQDKRNTEQDARNDAQDKRNTEQDARNDAQDKRNTEQDAKNDAQDKRNAEQDARNTAQEEKNKKQDAINEKQDEYNTYNTTIINKLSEKVQIVNKSQAQSVKSSEGILYFYTE